MSNQESKLAASLPQPEPKPCPHKLLRRCNVGNQRWYECAVCRQKFQSTEWGGKVEVVAASLPQPREVCPTCGSNKRDLRVRQECKYMCPPVNWKWVRDEYGRCTDFIECCNPWHELVAASLPVDRGAPDEREKFEAWARDLGCDLTRHAENAETYADRDMGMMWCGWRAGAGAASENRGAAQPDARKHVWCCIKRHAHIIPDCCDSQCWCRIANSTQPDLEAIALKWFPKLMGKIHGLPHDYAQEQRTACLKAMREALQLPSREKEQ
jgi:hypothetical protein